MSLALLSDRQLDVMFMSVPSCHARNNLTASKLLRKNCYIDWHRPCQIQAWGDGIVGDPTENWSQDQ